MNTKAIITIESLHKDFKVKNGTVINVLKDLSFSVNQNDFICIVGPSGCGKSTLLRIVAGLEQITEGKITYKRDIVSKPRREIGMVFQEYSLFPWRNVLDNVAIGLEFSNLGKSERKEKAMEYLRLVGMEAFSDSHSYELSGGMRQRVAIARALANDPDVLLMDEPFGALDAHTRILMQKELLRIWENHKKTILFVTHGVDEAIYLADKIIVMSALPGRIIEVLDVKIERPRHRNDPSYGELAERILAILEKETLISGKRQLRQYNNGVNYA